MFDVHRHAVLAGLLVAWAAQAAAGPALQSRDSIREAARAFLAEAVGQRHGADAEITVGRLDARLRLPRCDSPLETFATGTGRVIGATTVGVRCTGGKPWTLYVSARVRVYGSVLVAARPLPRGSAIEGKDLRMERKDLSALRRGYLTAKDEARGKVARRTIERGAVLHSRLLEAPKLVRRGDRVTLSAKLSGVEVRMLGTALSDGASGQRVRVRSLSSDRIVEGTVVSQGVVQVTL